MCDCALGIPFDGLDAGGVRHRDDTPDRPSRVTARLGHLFVNTTWTQPSAAVGRGDGSSAGRLDVETLLSSAAVTMEPEQFDMLQAVHVRAVGAVPLGAVGGGANSTSRGNGGAGDPVSNSAPRDDLAEKLREKTSRDDPVAVTLLPSRPMLCVNQGDGDLPERAQLGVAVSPIRFNITETHMLSLACFALSASARLAAISDALASLTSPNVQAQDNRSVDGSAVRESGVDLAPDECDRGERTSRSGSSMAAASQAKEVERVDGARADSDTDGGVRADVYQAATMSVAVAESQVAASSTPPSAEQETPHTQDNPPDHKHPNGLPSITEDQLGAAIGGRSDQQQSSGQLAGEGEPVAVAAAAAAATVSETAVAKAPPTPPAFLGTLIIEAISVMLLEDSGDYTGVARATGDGPSVSMTAEMHGAQEKPASALGATAAVLTPGRLRPALSPRREPSKRKRQGTSTPLPAPSRRCYSDLVFFEVEGIGAGVDLPRPWRMPSRPPPPPPPPGTAAAQSSPSSRVESPVAAAAAAVIEEGNGKGGLQPEHQQQYRAEFAIKRISLTDVSAKRRRQSSLATIVSDGVSGSTADAAAKNRTAASGTDGEDRRRDTGEDDVRVLPGGWWHRRNGGNNGGPSGRYGEQVLLSAQLCPVSGVAAVDARLASGRLMLLPAPILDALDMVAGVSQGITKYLRYTADAESSAEGNDGARSSGVRPAQVPAESVPRSAEHEVRSSRATVATSTPDNEEALPCSESATGRGQQTGDSMAGLVSPVVSGRRATTNAEDPDRGNIILSPPRREGGVGDVPGNTEEQRHRDSWHRQMSRALAHVGLADLLSLRRVDVSASARNLQLWLPGLKEVATAVTATATAVDESVHGDVEAVVVGCGTFFTDVSIAVGLLSEGVVVTHSGEQLAGLAGAAGEPGWSDAQQAAAAGDEKKACNDAVAAAAAVATDDAAETVFADSCNELCVMSLGLHGFEVFVARSSTADFGVPAEEPPQPVVVSPDLEAESGEHPPAAPDVGHEGLILPFSAKIKHVVFSRSPSSSSSASSMVPPSPSPLLSEIDASVTAIQVVIFLDFPLATRIMVNSFNPLLRYGTPASTGASGANVVVVTGAAGTPSVIHGLSPTVQGEGSGRLAGTSTEPAVVAAPPATVPGEAAAISELARMWTCRGGFEAAGLRAEIVNNFYRQKRPCVIVNVRDLVRFFVVLSTPTLPDRT